MVLFLDFLFTIAGAAYLGGKGISESSQAKREKRWVEQQGYNHERQWQLERMIHSLDPNERAEFDRLVGHPFNRDSRIEESNAVREIARREGWTYYDPHEYIEGLREAGIIPPKKY